jgi:hypothetical protein
MMTVTPPMMTSTPPMMVVVPAPGPLQSTTSILEEIPALQTKSLGDLKLLIENADALDAFLEQHHPYHTNTLAIQEELWDACEAVAQGNVARESELKTTLVPKVEASMREMTQKREVYERKLKEYHALVKVC